MEAIERSFFLKVNRSKPENIKCFTKWIEVCEELNAPYYIVCDNKKIRNDLISNINGIDKKKFVRSKRHILQDMVKNICTGNWENATYAHIFPFYYSEKNKINNHWDIDADDIMICLDKYKIIEMIYAIEKESKDNNVDAYSIDIWHSRTLGKHWSLGIVYVNNNSKIYKNIKRVKNVTWMNKYQNMDESFNLDWYFTYLRDENILSLRTFYVNNALLIHWGNFLLNPIYCGIIEWKDGYTMYPILKDILHYINSVIPISNMDNVDLKLEKMESERYLLNEITDIYQISEKRKFLYGIK